MNSGYKEYIFIVSMSVFKADCTVNKTNVKTGYLQDKIRRNAEHNHFDEENYHCPRWLSLCKNLY